MGLAFYQQKHCTFSYLVHPQRRDTADRIVAWAEGYALHEVGALSEEMFTARAAAESVVFGGKITADFLRLLHSSPIYRPELDLVKTGSDGSVAVFCTLWFDAQHQVGFVEPVRTVDAYRRLGLGEAVMLEGFRRLKMMGGTAVYLDHNPQ